MGRGVKKFTFAAIKTANVVELGVRELLPGIPEEFSQFDFLVHFSNGRHSIPLLFVDQMYCFWPPSWVTGTWQE